MRSATAGEIALLSGIGYNVYVRAWIANADGTFIDLSSLSGINWIEHVELDGDIDQPIAACTLYLKRDIGATMSLSPLRTDSPLNVRDDNVTFASLVDVGRDMYVETATVAIGATPGVGDWKMLFRGITDIVKQNDPVMEVSCRDLGAYLADAWFAAAQGFTFDPSVGEALETLVQTVLDNGGMDGRVTTVTLYTPVSPGEQITAFKYDIEPVLDAVVRLVQGIGWDVRYLWDEGTSTFRFTLIDPGRSKTTPDMTVGPDQYMTIPNFALDRTDVRNSITGTWGPADARVSKLYEDGTSISRYKKRSITFNEASDSVIDTEAEMDRMAAAALSDLKDPKADQQIEMLFNWRLELRDLLRFSANGVQYNTNQDLSIVRYKHVLGANGGTQHHSIVDVRGSPAGSYLNWLARAAAGQSITLNPTRVGILRISSTESSDGTKRNFVLTVGTLVNAVHVHYRTVSVDETQDTHDFSDTAVLPVDVGSPLLLRPASRLVTFQLAQPARGFLLAARFVPYSTSTGEGDSVPVTIDAAPPAINATIHATKVGALASLSIDIAFGISDGPVVVAVIERLLGVPSTLLTLPMSAPATIDWTTHPELSDRPIPSNADSLSWTVQITDVAGETWLFGPTVALPSVVNIKAVPSETTTTGTVTVTITDTGSYLDPTHVDGSVTSCISWHVTRLSVTTIVASTTAPGSGTSGTYTLTETLEPLHLIQVTGYVHYVDGSTESFGSWAFDPNKIADVVNATVANQSGVATVTIVWDTDALIGANCARYSLDGGSTWTSTVAISSGYLSQFTVAQSNVKQTVILQAKNAVDGGATYGNPTTVEVSALEVGTVYTECRAVVTAVSATQITVTVSGNVLTGTPTVGLVGLTGSASLASGHASGTYTYAVNGTDNVWVFNRAAMLSDRTVAGPGQAQFRSITTGAQSDDDFVTIPAQGVDTTFLAMRARVTASTATTATVRVAVADPYPQGAGSVTITYTETGGTGTACSPASGGTVTPAATLTEAAGTYIDYTVTRPDFSTGTRRVTFTATAANRVSDSDAVDIPAVERDTVPLAMKVVRGTTTGNAIGVTVAVADPYPQGSGNVTVTAVTTGGASVSPSSATIACTSTTTDVDTTATASFTITRGSAPGRCQFKATAASRIQATDAMDVEQDPTTITGASGSLNGLYSSLTNVDATYANPGTVAFGWAWSGGSVTHNIYVRDVGRYGDQLYHLYTTTGAGATSYTYTAGESISTTILNPTVVIGFYVEAVDGSTVGPHSVTCDTTYNT